MSKKILITGCTGLIGKEVLPYLEEEGYEIYAISRQKCENEKINFLQGSIFDEVFLKDVFNNIKPEYLLNFAWITGGDYLTNPLNSEYENACLEMLKLFKKEGGKRAVFAGTCFEYKQENKILTEDSPIEPTTLYASTKNNH